MIQTIEELEAFRTAALEGADDLKDSQYALERLFEVWANLNEDRRIAFDAVLAMWVSSHDAAERFDAEAIIDKFCRKALAANLAALRERLDASTDPEAPYEQTKIDRVLERLSRE